MADKVDPRTGELTTVNYGWTKPTVGASVDAWGGYINTDLDGIDSTVKSVSTVANAAYPATNPAGYQTAAQVTAAVPVASSTTPLVDGTAAVGTGTTWARADHVHPMSGWLGDNRIINGDMRIDQYNNGASGTAPVSVVVDRWVFNSTQASKGTWGRNLGAIVGPVGFPYYLGFTSASAYTVLSTDHFKLQSYLEGDAVSDFAWGTASAQPVTLSFWANSNLTGTFGGAVGDYSGSRSYPFPYSIPVANTWTRIIVTIPGDTSFAWVMSTNAGSLGVIFDFGSGSTKRSAANVWASGNYNGPTGAVSVVATNGARLYLTGVKLEIGSVATPFNRQSLAKSMADCQRYYQVGYAQRTFISSQASTTETVILPLSVFMRASPTMVGNFTTQTNATGSLGPQSAGYYQLNCAVTVAAGSGVNVYGTWTADAEL